MSSPTAPVVRRSRSTRVIALLAVLACLVAMIIAAPAEAQELTAEQEALAKKLEGKLIAPC